jgi:hypothetical protein
MTPDHKQRIAKTESALHRKLSHREYLFFGTAHEGIEKRRDDRTPMQRAESRSWRPKLAPIDGDPYAAQLAAEIAELEAATSADAPRLKLAKRELAKRTQMLADDAAKAKHLETVGPKLEKLGALRERVRWDEDWTVADVEAIERAIQQLEAVGGDPTYTNELYSRAFAIERGKKVEARDAAAAKAAELTGQRDAFDRELAELEGSQPAVVVKLSPHEIEGLWDAYEAAPAEHKDAALDKWHSAVSDFGGLDAVRGAQANTGATS